MTSLLPLRRRGPAGRRAVAAAPTRRPMDRACAMSRLLPRALMAPAVVTLFLWMIVPLVMTIYFSLVHYNLMQPGEKTFLGLDNFEYFVTDPDFGPSVVNTLVLLGSVIAITVVLRHRPRAARQRPVPRPRHRARAADLAVLRHAHGERAAVEAHDDEPDLRRARPGLAVLRHEPGRLADGPPAVLGDPDGGLAVAAVRLPDLHHLAAVAGSRPDGGRRAWTARIRCRSSGT